MVFFTLKVSFFLTSQKPLRSRPLKNTIDRLRKHLAGDSVLSKENYDAIIKHVIPQNPIVLVDDTDIVKPYGEKFESLCIVKDGSAKKNTYEKGYHVTEMVVLSK